MDELNVLNLMDEFKKMDLHFKDCKATVENLLSEGYSPDESLMLAGFGGYNN